MSKNIDAAFRSSVPYQCYVFVEDKYMVVNYAPGGKKNQTIDGPKDISKGFPKFVNTMFRWKIDSSFDTGNNLAYLFSGDHCVQIDYSPESPGNARLLQAPCPIDAMFPCLEGTVFKNGIDAAMRYDVAFHCAYLFKGDECCVINYQSKTLHRSTHKISNDFPLFLGTVFEGGIDAAFAVNNQVYFFKGPYYARILVVEHPPLIQFINGYIKLISKEWPALGSIL